MSAIVNPRDLLMQAAPSRLLPVTLPPNVIIPELVPDHSAVPLPTGFAVSAAISNIFVEHDSPVFTVGHGYLRTNVYGVLWVGGELPVFADAVKITSFSGQITSHATNPALVWHLWITWVSRDGIESLPAGGTNGLVATTGQDVERMVAAMTGPGNPFTVLDVDTTIDGVLFPAGTYSSKAFIADAQISNAKIKNLAVDDAKISNLGVDKLIAGSIAVGEYIQSTGFIAGDTGWRIKGDGTAELSGVIVRGTMYASAGQIGGNTIDASGVESPSYASGMTGWRLDSDGIFQAFGYSGTRVIDMSATGTSPAIKFGSAFQVLGNGTATFSGTLSAAGGTFAGTLTAGAINAVDTINIAGEAVTVAMAASGTSGVTTATSNFQGGSVILLAPIKLVLDFSSGSWSGGSAQLQIKRNSTAIETRAISWASGSADPGRTETYDLTLAAVDAPGAVDVAYSVTVELGGSGVSATSDIQICAFGGKR